MFNPINHALSSARSQLSSYWEWSKKNRAVVITALVAPILTTWKWGTVAGISFAVAWIPNISFLAEKVDTLCRIELGPLKQAAAILSIPAVYFCSPFYASLYLPPLCLAVAASVIKREWDHQAVAKKSEQEIAILQEQTDRLSKARDDILSDIAKIEKIMAGCLEVANQGKQLVVSHNQTAQNIQEIDLKIDDQLTQIKEKSARLQSFYGKAMETLQSKDRTESRLNELVEKCEERQKDLARLNQEIHDSSEKLKKIVVLLENEIG